MPPPNSDNEHLKRSIDSITESLRQVRAKLRRYVKRVAELRDLSVEHDAQASAIDSKTTLILDSVRKLIERIEGSGMRESYDVRIERNVTKLEGLREEIVELRRLLKEDRNSTSGWVQLVFGAIISGVVAYAVAALTK